MLKIVERKNIDEEKWNAAVKNSVDYTVFGLTWFLDSVCNWSGVIFGDYEAVFPLPNSRKFLLKYAYMPYGIPYFCIYGKNITESNYVDLLALLKREFFLFDLTVNNQFVPKIKGVKQVIRKSQELSLSSSYEELKNQFSNSHKRNIKKAVSNNLSVKEISLNEDSKGLIEIFYQSKKLKIADHLDDYFKMIEEMQKWDLCTILGVFNSEAELCNVSIFRKINNKRVSLNSINSNGGRELGAMFFALNQFFIENQNSELVLDFEGSNIDSIRRRNIGFGAKDYQYTALNYRKI